MHVGQQSTAANRSNWDAQVICVGRRPSWLQAHGKVQHAYKSLAGCYKLKTGSFIAVSQVSQCNDIHVQGFRWMHWLTSQPDVSILP